MGAPALRGAIKIVSTTRLDMSRVALERVWSVVERDLPPLRAAVEAMLKEIGPEKVQS